MSFLSLNLPRVSSANLVNVGLMIGNAVGIVLYLVLASGGWRIPEEDGMVPVTGEPFVWAFALPVFGIFFLLNVIWGIQLLRHKERKGRFGWVVTAVVWLLAIVIDFSHH